jgi:hypothetical protein
MRNNTLMGNFLTNIYSNGYAVLTNRVKFLKDASYISNNFHFGGKRSEKIQQYLFKAMGGQELRSIKYLMSTITWMTGVREQSDSFGIIYFNYLFIYMLNQ